MKTIIKTIVLFAALIAAIAFFSQNTHAFSGFPSNNYPYNNYGIESTYYNGPWGERMVYGGHGYFPNFNGNRPYGYRTYGYMYTNWDMRYGTMMGRGW